MDNRFNPNKDDEQQKPPQNRIALLRQQLASQANTHETKKTAIEENLFKGKQAQLKSGLFQSLQKTDSQKATTLQELKKLQANAGNVREKAKYLEELLNQSSAVVKHLKSNKVSEDAKAALTQPKEKASFDKQQDSYLDEVNSKVKNDLQALYINAGHQQTISFQRFLELSLTYRAYQVCLEQDFYRHAAYSVMKSTLSLTPADRERIITLNSNATRFAVESLNYYADFFKNLPEIENIWSEAGKLIRNLEVRLIFVATLYNHQENILDLIVNPDPSSPIANLFNFVYAQYCKTNEAISSYIESGDGLDIAKHPWKLNRYERLPQPNKTLKIDEIIPQNNIQKAAVQTVETRVEEDKRRYSP